MINNIIIAYAGRVAQIKKFGDDGIDTGASSDINKATTIAYSMVAKYGMDDDLRLVDATVFESFSSEKIENGVLKILHNAQIEIEKLVDTHWDKIEKVAKILVKQDTITNSELNYILK